MENKKIKYLTNLYKENVFGNDVENFTKNKIFQGANIGLREYLNYINESIKVVNKQGTIEVFLKKEKVAIPPKMRNGKYEDVKETRHYLELGELKRKDKQRVENELFFRETKIIYIKIPTGDRKKDSDYEIEILERNEAENYIIIDVGKDQEISSIFIKANDYQLKMQRKAIQELMNQPQPEHGPLLRLFEKSDHAARFYVNNHYDEDEYLVDEDEWKVLSDETRDGTIEQRDFVRKALRTKDFALLEGPPGSGKTTAIIELVIQLIKRDKRVLLVSATHVAVDNVIDRILTAYGSLCKGTVVPLRIGSSERSISKESVKPYLLQNFKRQIKRDIKKNLRAKRDIESREMFYDCLNVARENRILDDIILQSANLVGGTMIGILQHPDIREKGTGEMFDVMIVDESSKVTFLDFIVPALYAKKWILVGDVNQLSPYVEDDFVSEAINTIIPVEGQSKVLKGFDLLQKLNNGNPYDKQCLKILFSDEHTPRDFKEYGEIYQLPDDFQVTEKNILLLNALDILICKANNKSRKIIADHIYVKSMVFEANINQHSFKNRQQYFNRRNKSHKNRNKKGYYQYEFSHDKSQNWGNLVGSKLSQAYQYRMYESGESSINNKLQKDLDILIPPNFRQAVEGIRKIALPSILELLQVGAGETKSKNDYIQNKIIYDGFSAFENIVRDKFQSLSYQHRMNDQIAKIPRKYFYKNKNLKTANTVSDRPNTLADYKNHGESSVIWVFNNDKEYDRNRENINPTEVQHIKQELISFVDFAKHQQREYEVAVLTFYRAQERDLKYMLRKWTGSKGSRNFRKNNVKLTLCTVDKFQGDEADMVLLSFVKNTRGAFYNSPNRLNVALTRARYKLILYGNLDLKDRAPSEVMKSLATEFPSRKHS